MQPCNHDGTKPVRAGPYQLYAGGTMYDDFLLRLISSENMTLVALTDRFDRRLSAGHAVLPLFLPDFGGVSDDWRSQLEGIIIPKLEAGDMLLAFCVGSHGRTGTFLASLIALLETRHETPDPIAAVRERHCEKSVETYAQAAAVLALRGEPLWPAYQHGLYGNVRAVLGS